MRSADDSPRDDELSVEARRLLSEYDRRDKEIPAAYYSPFEPGVLFAKQTRDRAVLGLLRAAGVRELGGLSILDVGCGSGDWLADLEAWGAVRGHLAGIELHPSRAEAARARLGPYAPEDGSCRRAGADIRCGDASSLPWDDASFDLVVLSTVLSSILAAPMRHAVASECARVLRKEGVILWYDFFVDNPRNRAVRGVRRREIECLFPGFGFDLSRVTLAPPLARWLAARSWPLAAFLQGLRVLDTHYLGLFRRS